MLLDELDKCQNKWLVNFLKTWTDWMPLTGEVKGGTIPLTFTEFRVTCQHSIQEFFTENGQLVVG